MTTPRRPRGTRQLIVDRRLSSAGEVVRYLACGHTQVEVRGGQAAATRCANCKECRRAFLRRDAASR